MPSQKKVVKTIGHLLKRSYIDVDTASTILSAYLKRATRGHRMLKDLISYLSLHKKDRRIELLYIAEFYIRNNNYSIIENTLDDPRTPSQVVQEISNLSEDEYLTDLSQKAVLALAQHISDKDKQNLLREISDSSPEDYPLWEAAYLISSKVLHGWLFHCTNSANADDIESEGFRYGVDDMRYLALTTYVGKSMKKNGGFNFAYTPRDFKLYGKRNRYGSKVILFYAPYVYLYHDLDNEPQAIFWGKDATNIHRVYNYDGDYTILFEEDDGDEEEVEVSSINDLVSLMEKRTGKK